MKLSKTLNWFLILLLCSASFSNGYAQDCLPDHITLSSQQEVDDFVILYPNCDVTEGELRIYSIEIFDEITNSNEIDLSFSFVKM